MSKRAAAPVTPSVAAKRPGAGVTIDQIRLKRLREEAMMSRADLARKMSDGPETDPEIAFTITPDAIAKIENGWRRPKPITFERLCSALGISSVELLPVPPVTVPLPCRHCAAMYGHEPGCPDAT